MTDNKILELFGNPSKKIQGINWQRVIQKQWCPFANTRCFKVRKSQPEISIGTCTVRYGRDNKDVIICPNRLLERKQVFTDCVHLLTLHEPGNEFHVVPEVSIPGGSVDYFLVSAKGGKVRDFVAIEFQTLDTTGTVWPERQRALKSLGLSVRPSDVQSTKGFGMNWKMTAKTILMQLHHKVQTFEHINKHLVLVVQNYLLHYMRAEFDFAHLGNPRIGDAMHFHAYKLNESEGVLRLELESRVSTDAEGIAKCLGLQAEAKVELEVIVAELEKKISTNTVLTLGPTPIAPMEQMPTE
jgi:hypothetical protein